ncbi:MAG: hypothetical protein GY755_21720 [Chloroflexi bacterium]|nr:hypothetical protein [Chloroflexota bacterium]
MNLKKRILKTQYKKNCFILCSFAKKDMSKTFGDFRVKPNISFLYDSGNIAAEWEPEHGPIQIWRKAESGKEHYYYDFVEDISLNWSQTAVDDYSLPEYVHSGDFDYIFRVLKDWAERN